MDKEMMKNSLREHSTLGRMQRLGNMKPEYRIGFRKPDTSPDTHVTVLPFKRLWPAIIILAICTGGFFIPLLNMPFSLGNAEDLFDLTTTLFMLFWAVGWGFGILLMAGILTLLLFARELVIVSPDGIRLRIECCRFGIESNNPLSRICNLRYRDTSPDKGTAWRNGHLVFDYLGVPVCFGSNLDSQRGEILIKRINAALDHPVPPSLDAAVLAQVDAQADAPVEEPPQQPVRTANDASAVTSTPQSRRLSLWLLLAANLVPLFGALVLGWNIGDIMLLFWLESAIVALFNVLKMFRIAGPVAIFYSLFFIAHFGAFMAVHLMFVFSLFIEDGGQSSSLAEVAQVFRSLWVAILALVISHGFSYVENFLGRREYERITISKQMHQPYARIFTMHITLIFGGFLILALDAPLLALCLLIVLKMTADGAAHIKQHRKT